MQTGFSLVMIDAMTLKKSVALSWILVTPYLWHVNSRKCHTHKVQIDFYLLQKACFTVRVAPFLTRALKESSRGGKSQWKMIIFYRLSKGYPVLFFTSLLLKLLSYTIFQPHTQGLLSVWRERGRGYFFPEFELIPWVLGILTLSLST